MACENFAISLVDAGDDDVKHNKMDDTLMLVWLGRRPRVASDPASEVQLA